jgi:plastocyanin
MKMRVLAVVAVVAVLAAGCGGGSSKKGATTPTLPSSFAHPVDLRGKAKGGEYPEVDVASKDNDFSPAAIRIDPGTTVHWTNEGRSPHDITAVVFGKPTGKEMGVAAAAFGPGKSYEYRFPTAGVYRYYCSLG